MSIFDRPIDSVLGASRFQYTQGKTYENMQMVFKLYICLFLTTSKKIAVKFEQNVRRAN